MNDTLSVNYDRIAEAINYICKHYKSQPGLEEIAGAVHLSPFHFQRMFIDWAGVSPKKFVQYLSLKYAKGILQNKQATLSETAYETGLSGTGRLHDLFITIEGMTPGEYKNGGKDLLIQYSFDESPFGKLIVASTHKGICHLAFAKEEAPALQDLKNRFPNAVFQSERNSLQEKALSVFKNKPTEIDQIRLHLKASDFQLKVWEALLKIPKGDLSTYGEIARHISAPGASRAVGTAIGKNPVAFLIPCHRVIKSNGVIGNYMWGSTRKTAMIGWEAATKEQVEQY